MSFIDATRKWTLPLERRIRAMTGRAVINLVNDAVKMQLAQIDVLDGETFNGVERMQEYGFTSKPFAGAEAAVIFLGGNRGVGIIVACDDRRYRLTGLPDGEVALYDDLGQHVWLKRTGIVVDAPLGATINGNVAIVGDLTATGEITRGKGGADQVGLGTHDHGGVQPGAGNTGAPVAGT